jgi:hypothetical protein
MKETIISVTRKKRELIIFSIAFSVAFFMNVYAVISYKRPVIELFTQLHVVLLLTFFIYGVLAILRILWWLFTQLYKSIVKN